MDNERFDWDPGNIEHITDVEPEEAEEAVLDPDRIPYGAYNYKGEQRRALLGRTEEGYLLFVVYTHRHKKVRVISVRFADPTEQRRYRNRGK